VGVKVLHCYGDFKWTGPSEPVAMLCRELCRRGWDVELACMRAPGGYTASLSGRARQMGLTAHEDFYWDSRPNIRKNMRDIDRLRELIRDGGFGIVHVHGSWDHALVAVALRYPPRRPPLVRTDHGGREFRGRLIERWQFGPGSTDHLIVLSDRFRARAVESLRREPHSVTTVPGAVDVQAYRPRPAPPGMRSRLGLAEEDLVFGIVARVQQHRRFEVLLKAFESVRDIDGRIKLVVLGRGTQKERILDRPIARMGLEQTVFPLGYRRTDYHQVLAMLDAGVMLVPGSDASCRAALQMAAMGKPMVVAQRGVLPDIVLDGQTGIVVQDTPRKLANAILEMAHSPQKRRRWGAAARQRTVSLFSPQRQAAKVEAVYQRLLSESR